MKHPLIAKATIFVFATLFIFSACKKKDDNSDTDGSGGGSSSTNASYAGNWNVSETCTSPWSYAMSIAAVGSNSVTITNFHKGTYATGFTINGTVSGNTLTIPNQSATSSSQSGPYTFSGTGTLTPPSSLSISYTMKDISGAPMSCSSNCTK